MICTMLYVTIWPCPATKLISSYAFIIQLWIILKRTPLSPLKRCYPFCLVRKGLGQKQIYSKHITLWMAIQIDYISCIWRFCHWRWELLFKFPFLQSFLLHYPKYLSYSRLTNIQDQITLFYFMEKKWRRTTNYATWMLTKCTSYMQFSLKGMYDNL